jgi:hypothetical protein
MKQILLSFALIFSMFLAGCETQLNQPETIPAPVVEKIGNYAAAKIHVMGLSQITPDPAAQQGLLLNVYIDILDEFDSRIKAPGMFRFELYEYVPRSSDPKGKRVFMADDIDLTDPAENNKFWRDHLRSYQFDLPLGQGVSAGRSFIVEATVFTPAGRRLSHQRQLEYCQ